MKGFLKAGTVLLLGLVLAGNTWAGENAGASIMADLELAGAVEAGYQGGKATQTGIGADQTLLLYIYTKGVSNILAYTFEVGFDATKLDYVSGAFMSMNPAEFGALASWSPSNVGPSLKPGTDNVIGGGSAILTNPPAADQAPDGDGLLLAVLTFKTKADFTVEKPAAFWLSALTYKGVDGVEDDASVNWDPTYALAAINRDIGVEGSSWAKIKALFK